MGYIYILTKAGNIIGATTRKYTLKTWNTGDVISSVEVERFEDGKSLGKSVKFTLKEYLENPDKQFKS